MFLSKVLLFTILLAPMVFCCYHNEIGCHYTNDHQTKNEAQCPPARLNLTLEKAVIWPNNSLGRMDATFPIFDVKCEVFLYSLELYVYENLTEETCGCNLKPINNWHKVSHSKRKYSTKRTCLDQGNSCQHTCGEAGVVTFQFVFSGCYQLAVEPQDNLGTKLKSYSCGKYLRTNYSKKLIAGMIPYVSHQNLPALQETQLFYPVVPLVETTYQIYLNNTKWGCMHCNNTACECEPMYSNYHQLQCSIIENGILFVFKELPPGNYCLNVGMFDDRCEEGTLWTNEAQSPGICQWNSRFPVVAESLQYPGLPDPDYSHRVYIVLAVVSLMVVVAIIIALIAMRSYITKHRSRTTLSPLPSSLIPMEPNRIFLLYARDCQPFMALMETLREVLEDTTKCEVIDSLDASRWNEIGRSPVDWVRCHIEHPNTKVVLVATHCAYLRQQAHLKQVTTHYKEPGNYDNLFVYGLKALTENLSSDVYRKVCVVRFEGFSDDGNLFNHLTPYTRFVLPLHLHKLVANLRLSASPEPNEQLIENKEVQKLSQDLTQLINYVNKNINYLQDILSIQRNEVTC